MHDDGIGFCDLHTLGADAVVGEVFVDARDSVEAANPLTLNSERHDDVSVFQTGIEIVEQLRVRHIVRVGRQGRRRDQPQFAHAKRVQSFGGRAGDARMCDVTDNRHGQVLETALVLANRQQVQKALCRVRHIRLTGIEDADVIVDMPRDVGGHPGARVAHHHDIDLHRLQRVDRVENALAFLARGRVDVEIQNIRAEAFAGKVERRARPRARLEKQVGDGATFE